MNERLVEDWLAKANERSYQTPFAESLVAEGMEVLRVGHSPHEHGKDVIAIDKAGKVHAYQLKDGDFDIKDFEKDLGQITALVETQVEHPSISGHPRHQPWLVISGQTTIPVEDRIRVHNITWRKRRYAPLKLITGTQLLARFAKMAGNFWPQPPSDSNRLFNLYLADGRGNLDREAFAKLITGIIPAEGKSKELELSRALAAAALFASYALSPFYASKNYWELVQGWTMTAAHIAWVADQAGLAHKTWHSTFQLAVDSGLAAREALANESLEPNALHPTSFTELDELTRTRCTICAGAIAAQVLVDCLRGRRWQHESLAKEKLEQLFSGGRFILWGESAVPFFLTTTWALDQLRPDHLADTVLLATLGAITGRNSRHSFPKLPPPYDSPDEANAKALRRLFAAETALDLQATASYTLESLVTLVARRLWRNALAALWSPITKIDLVRLVPDAPRDLLLWRWGYNRESNQSRKFGTPQSWQELLSESRRNEDASLPAVITDEPDFAVLFVLCFPHRLTRGLVKHLEEKMRHL